MNKKELPVREASRIPGHLKSNIALQIIACNVSELEAILRLHKYVQIRNRQSWHKCGLTDDDLFLSVALAADLVQVRVCLLSIISRCPRRFFSHVLLLVETRSLVVDSALL